MNPKIAEIKDYIMPLRELLLQHPVYKQLRHLNDLNILMEQHVFAVWDFMALLKSLQFGLTSTNAPWMPIGNPKTRRLINEVCSNFYEIEDETGFFGGVFNLAFNILKKPVELVKSGVHKISSSTDLLTKEKKTAQPLEN